MALIVDTVFKDIPVAQVLVTVSYLSIGDERDSMSFSSAYRASATSPVFLTESHTSPCNLAGPDPFTQSYAYLKTLPQFASAVDA